MRIVTKSQMQARIAELENALGAILDSHSDYIEASEKGMKHPELKSAKDTQILAQDVYDKRKS